MFYVCLTLFRIEVKVRDRRQILGIVLKRDFWQNIFFIFCENMADIVVRGTMRALDISIYQFPRLLLHPFDFSLDTNT